MAKYLLSFAVLIIGGGFVGCIFSQQSGIGDPSVSCGIGCLVGLIGSICYYLDTKDQDRNTKEQNPNS